MVELKNVKAQLTKVGYKMGSWQRAEVKELSNILHSDEIIVHAANGRYEGGFALLVATDQRLILVDRKIMFLTLDSIPYFMIQEVTFNYRLLNSTIHIYTSNKVLDFSSWSQGNLRDVLTYTQQAMRLTAKGMNYRNNTGATDAPSQETIPAPVLGNVDAPAEQVPEYQSVTMAPDEQQDDQRPYLQEANPDEIPTLPQPKIPQMAAPVDPYATSIITPMTVSPENMVTNSLSAFKTPKLAQRRYSRRYF